MTQDQAIAEITCRLVDYYRPERIYLFGSAARGDGGPDAISTSA
jgi:predicted nucleotidyltransferase